MAWTVAREGASRRGVLCRATARGWVSCWPIRPAWRAALGVVTGQRRRPPVGEELPVDGGDGGQCGGRHGRVLQCLAGPLAEVRRHGVGGIAEQGDPARGEGGQGGRQLMDVVVQDGVGPGGVQQRGDRIVPVAEAAAHRGKGVRMPHRGRRVEHRVPLGPAVGERDVAELGTLAPGSSKSVASSTGRSVMARNTVDPLQTGPGCRGNSCPRRRLSTPSAATSKSASRTTSPRGISIRPGSERSTDVAPAPTTRHSGGSAARSTRCSAARGMPTIGVPSSRAARHTRPCRAAARRARLYGTIPRGALDVGVAVRRPRGIASRSAAQMVARTLCEDARHSARIDRAGLTGGQAAREASIACVPLSRAASS